MDDSSASVIVREYLVSSSLNNLKMSAVPESKRQKIIGDVEKTPSAQKSCDLRYQNWQSDFAPR